MSKSISFDPFSHGIQKTGFTGEYTRKMEELDKLAFFFSIKGPCAAAGFYGDMKKVYIAYNSSLKGNSDIQFQFLKKILQAKETPPLELITGAMIATNIQFFNSIKALLKILEDRHNKMIQNHIKLKECGHFQDADSLIPKIKSSEFVFELLTFFKNRLEDFREKFEKRCLLPRNKSDKVESCHELATSYALDFYKNYNNLYSCSEIHTVYSVNDILNIRGVAEFILSIHKELSEKDYQSIKNPDSLHAELALYHHEPNLQIKYIGVSIKSCEACFSALTSVGFQVQGSHTIVDNGGVNSLLKYLKKKREIDKKKDEDMKVAATLISDGRADGDEYFQDPHAYNPHATKSLTDDDYRSRYHEFSDSKEEVCYEDSSEYQFSYDDSSEEEVSDDEDSSEIARKFFACCKVQSAASLAAQCTTHFGHEESADISTMGVSYSADE